MNTDQSLELPVGYRQLLKQNGRFRRLWTAQLISAAGDWFNSVAVFGLVLQLTNSGFGASLVLLSSTIPMFFLTPIAGPVVDRFDRRKLMIITNLVAAGVALMFLFVHDSASVWLVYVANILLITTASFFGPASAASIPNIVSRAELFSANVLSGATWSIMVMVGSALGGIVSTIFGRETAFVINAISFVVAALLIASIKIPGPKTEKALTPWRDFAEGLRYLREYPAAMALVGVKTGWGLAGGVIVLLSVFGQQVFKAGDAGIGLLYAARGLGALIGPFVVQAIAGGQVKRLRRALWLSFILSGLGYFILSAAGWMNAIWLGFFALVLAHLGGGVNWAISSLMLQLTTPDRLRGRVFAVDFGLSTLTTGISTLIVGLALQGGVQPMVLAVIGAAIFCTYGMIWGIGTSRGSLQISEATMETTEQSP